MTPRLLPPAQHRFAQRRLHGGFPAVVQRIRCHRRGTIPGPGAPATQSAFAFPPAGRCLAASSFATQFASRRCSSRSFGRSWPDSAWRRRLRAGPLGAARVRYSRRRSTAPVRFQAASAGVRLRPRRFRQVCLLLQQSEFARLQLADGALRVGAIGLFQLRGCSNWRPSPLHLRHGGLPPRASGVGFRQVLLAGRRALKGFPPVPRPLQFAAAQLDFCRGSLLFGTGRRRARRQGQFPVPGVRAWQ